MLIEQPPKILRWLYPGALWRMDTNEKAVYLTFDDGPIPDITPWVLDVLDKYQIKAHVHRDGDQLKGLWVESAQTRHGVEQGQGILARRDAHGDPVPRADHLIVVHGAAGITQYVFHVIHKDAPWDLFSSGAAF